MNLPLERDLLLNCKECGVATVIVSKGTILNKIGDCLCADCSLDQRPALDGFDINVSRTDGVAIRLVSEEFQTIPKPVPEPSECSLWDLLKDEWSLKS